MKRIVCLIGLFFIFTFVEAQTLGGYTIHDHLVSANHPNGCNSAYVTSLPNDSIWVNFVANEMMTGYFSMPVAVSGGDNLLLETGYNTANYIVSLLLSNGQYSLAHNVVSVDWGILPNGLLWQYINSTNNCFESSSNGAHFILPLNFTSEFGLTSADTVIGIKIIFLASVGAPDFAGAYIVGQFVGINEQAKDFQVRISPNPFSNEININFTNNYISEIAFYDITSRKILQKKITNSVTLNTEQLSRGIYLYELSDKNGVVKKGKMVKN